MAMRALRLPRRFVRARLLLPFGCAFLARGWVPLIRYFIVPLECPQRLCDAWPHLFRLPVRRARVGTCVANQPEALEIVTLWLCPWLWEVIDLDRTALLGPVLEQVPRLLRPLLVLLQWHGGLEWSCDILLDYD